MTLINLELETNNMDYSIIKPQAGYIAIKDVEEEKTVLKKVGNKESNSYGKVVAIGADSKFELDQLVVYNEYEGQELVKYGKIKEEGIIILKEENILAIIL